MNLRPISLALLLAAPLLLSAAVVGTNPPALPLTAERIATLPAAEQPAWQAYLARSRALMAKDKAFFAEELRANNITTPTTPTEGRGGGAMSLNRQPEWFAGDEARKIADNTISFQTPAGGWSKNMNFASHARAPGERFAAANLAPAAAATTTSAAKTEDNDKPADATWHYVGTFDNDATITQLRFLAHVAAALDEKTGAPYRASVVRGLDYVFNAQFPNGGFPQVYPLEGGYHDTITFNDNALINILSFLTEVAEAKNGFTFLTAEQRARAAASVQRGVACILACQIVTNGRRTVWCQQHDALTLAPASARNYEMPSQSGSESDDVMIFLMELPNPSPAVVTAVHAAAAWFQKTQLHDVAFRREPGAPARALVKAPGAPPLWARYYEIGSDRPLFGDRDKSIHDDVSEISVERRNGYSWFNNGPDRALEIYATWAKAHPAS